MGQCGGIINADCDFCRIAAVARLVEGGYHHLNRTGLVARIPDNQLIVCNVLYRTGVDGVYGVVLAGEAAIADLVFCGMRVADGTPYCYGARIGTIGIYGVEFDQRRRVVD